MLPAILVVSALSTACGASTPPEPQTATPPYDDQSIVARGGVLTREQIVRIRATRMDQLFEGRFSGVQVLRRGGQFILRIRGAAEPLVVIDGVPAIGNQTLWGMNPYDVDQIEILKNSGTSAYGLRGANGVVLVTTRTR